MLRAKLTSKGQITIPVAVRRKFNLQPGDELIFDFDNKGEIKVKPLKKKTLTELFATLKTNKPYSSKSEVREEVAKELAKKFGLE
ncbi:Transcriptional regulator, AbrB family [Carboxydothermus islandicus]|uniref:Transcriptional regulator, AbrB family n=1 Tax=Carboxydothermus islandicus TaxID=661089 RepID=A0A1L8CZW7_9THEO|nr:AbrB/MazE/SpoVT family DNA-binding domain-containing protein [Carboxydothermus islandicus]GAV24460.1 Transcriptional regulator, AbrB family [Carboxydothermus islandicus]